MHYEPSTGVTFVYKVKTVTFTQGIVSCLVEKGSAVLEKKTFKNCLCIYTISESLLSPLRA